MTSKGINMSKINRLLRVTATAALLPVFAHTAAAFAGTGGKAPPAGPIAPIAISVEDPPIFHGPGGTRPMHSAKLERLAVASNDNGGVGGPGGAGKPPIRPNVVG
jgi:hypothetical protein